MHCPYCQAAAFECQLRCEACGFSLEALDGVFGVVPRLQPGISDLAGLLRARDFRRIKAAAGRLSARFPQVAFSVVTTAPDSARPLRAWAFWIFNRGGVCRNMERAGKCRDILLTLDSESRQAAMTIGYGLEPFLSRDHLAGIVGAGASAFRSGRVVDGIVAVIDKAAEVLGAVSSALERTYGLDMADVRRSEDPAFANVTAAGVY